MARGAIKEGDEGKRHGQMSNSVTKKKKKIFPEALGKEHLMALSRSIAEDESSKLQIRIDRAKEKTAWEKERRAANKERDDRTKNTMRKQNNGSSTKISLSKGSIRAALLKKQREKSKKRREARKKSANDASPLKSSVLAKRLDSGIKERKKKQVSFA